MYGADDFLPMLTYVVAQCNMPRLDTDIQYMMELLDPSLLQGEGRFFSSAAVSEFMFMIGDGCKPVTSRSAKGSQPYLDNS